MRNFKKRDPEDAQTRILTEEEDCACTCTRISGPAAAGPGGDVIGVLDGTQKDRRLDVCCRVHGLRAPGAEDLRELFSRVLGARTLIELESFEFQASRAPMFVNDFVAMILRELAAANQFPQPEVMLQQLRPEGVRPSLYQGLGKGDPDSVEWWVGLFTKQMHRVAAVAVMAAEWAAKRVEAAQKAEQERDAEVKKRREALKTKLVGMVEGHRAELRARLVRELGEYNLAEVEEALAEQLQDEMGPVMRQIEQMAEEEKMPSPIESPVQYELVEGELDENKFASAEKKEAPVDERLAEERELDREANEILEEELFTEGALAVPDDEQPPTPVPAGLVQTIVHAGPTDVPAAAVETSKSSELSAAKQLEESAAAKEDPEGVPTPERSESDEKPAEEHDIGGSEMSFKR